MDGVRARRMKNGSPVGRIVDEALDTLQQACYGLWLGYVFRFDNLLFELMFLMPNLIFYTMEMKYVICKNLEMIIGEIGPVEIELLMASILISAGYFGIDGLQQTLGEAFGTTNMLSEFKLKFLTGGLFLPL